MLWTVTATTLREMPRRRAALGFAFLLPLVFYASRINVQWQAIRFMAIGVGWAMATLSFFSSVSSRRLDRRLSALGASPTALLAGRQMATTAIGLVVAAVYSSLLLATQDLTRPFFAVLSPSDQPLLVCEHGIRRARGDELAVAADGFDLPVSDDQDEIAVDDRRQAVSHHDGGATTSRLGYRIPQLPFVVAVHLGRGLVQKQDRPSSKQNARDGQALPLTA